MKRVGITTIIRVTDELIAKTMKISEALDTVYYPRESKSIKKLICENNLDYVIVVEKGSISIRSENSTFFWHPNTSVIKARNLNRGDTIPMIKAMDISQGDSVLDCTLGMAADAIVSSLVVGERGKVVGLEADKYIYFITKEGLSYYRDVDESIKGAMSRISIINERYENYLQTLEDDSYDVVYLDPMFVNPNEKSDAMGAMSFFADHSPLTIRNLYEAMRVARKRVVVKLRYGSEDFTRLGIKDYVGKSRLGALVFGYFTVD